MAQNLEDRLIQAEDLPGLRIDGPYELVAGRIVRMSPAGLTHGMVVGYVNRLLSRHVDRLGRGMVTSGETGFRVRRNPDSVRAPDLAYVSPETLTKGKAAGETFFPCAPDLAVEVLSPDDSWEAVEEKVREYLSAGAKTVWVISPTLRQAYVYEPGRPRAVLEETDAISGGAALPEFAARVRDLLEGEAAP